MPSSIIPWAAALTEIRIAEQVSQRPELAIDARASRRLGREAGLLDAMLSSFARIRQALPARAGGADKHL